MEVTIKTLEHQPVSVGGLVVNQEKWGQNSYLAIGIRQHQRVRKRIASRN